MLIKKENNKKNYIKYLLLIISIGVLFYFKVFFVSSFLNIKQKYFLKTENLSLTQSEREELNNLRIQNKVLKFENEQVKTEFSMPEVEEKVSPVYLLLAQSSLYGDFYITAPKDKTVYKGMYVYTSGNIVVGLVSEVLANSLKVERLGQGKTFVASSLEGGDSIEFSSLGSGLYVGQATGGSKISLGDTILLKGYPKAVVGTVVEIAKNNTSLSVIYVRTPYNIDEKQIFYVLQ